MSLGHSLLYEYDHEMETTRKFLALVPENKMTYKPHPKSFEMGKLANHLALLPAWAVETMNRDSLDVTNFELPPPATNSEGLLIAFDKAAAAGRAAIEAAPDDAFGKPWSLTGHGKTFFSMPRSAVLRNFVMNHLVHHRAQLGLYLRLNDVPIPGSYGPSADDPQM